MANIRYFLFELPSNLVIRRIGAANWLTFIIVCWGAVTIGMGFVPSWQLLALCRALLGCFEVFFLTHWFLTSRLAFFLAVSILSVAGTNDTKFKLDWPSFICPVSSHRDFP